MCPHRGQREVVTDAGGTEGLNGAVDDVGQHLGSDNFNHGDLFLSGLFTQGVDHPGGFEGE